MNLKNIVLSSMFAAVVLVGCGSDNPPIQRGTADVANAQEMRRIFDKNQGNYDGMSAEDKAAYLKASANGEEKAKKDWEAMKAHSQWATPGTQPGAPAGVPAGAPTGSSAGNASGESN